MTRITALGIGRVIAVVVLVLAALQWVHWVPVDVPNLAYVILLALAILL